MQVYPALNREKPQHAKVEDTLQNEKKISRDVEFERLENQLPPIIVVVVTQKETKVWGVHPGRGRHKEQSRHHGICGYH